jgi:hypothetical protein
LDRGANRTVTNDLADGAERAGLLAGVQEGATMEIKLADPCNFVVVVKNLGRKKMNLTREQYAHYQGTHPKFVPVFC